MRLRGDSIFTEYSQSKKEYIWRVSSFFAVILFRSFSPSSFSRQLGQSTRNTQKRRIKRENWQGDVKAQGHDKTTAKNGGPLYYYHLRSSWSSWEGGGGGPGGWWTHHRVLYKRWNRVSVFAHSAGAYNATLLLMVNVMKGGGRAPPTLTRPG